MEPRFPNAILRARSPMIAMHPKHGSDIVLRTQELAPNTSDGIQGRRLVYLLSIFPAVSHTFFLNEVRELRRLGFNVEVASINQPDLTRSSMAEAQAAEMAKTFYIKSSGPMRAIWIAAKTLLRRPWVFARGLLAALRLGRWDLVATLYAFFYFAEALILGDWMLFARPTSYPRPLLRTCGNGGDAGVQGVANPFLAHGARAGRIL